MGMERRGHLGLSMLAIFGSFSVLGIRDMEALFAGLVALALSTVPDMDMRMGMRHRGVTHSLGFAVLLGILTGAMFLYMGLPALLGFLAGFGGVALHIVGDMLTYRPITPMWPLSGRRIALRLFRSNSRLANGLASAAGSAALLYYLAFVLTDVGWRALGAALGLLEW